MAVQGVALVLLLSASLGCTTRSEQQTPPELTVEETALDPTIGSPPPRDPPKSRPTQRDIRRLELSLVPVVRIRDAIAMAVFPGVGSFYLATRTGRVLKVQEGRVRRRPVLDVSSEVAVEGEQGFLGLAVSPGGDLLYASYTDTAGHVKVVEYVIEEGDIQLSSRRTVVQVRQETVRHVGGNLVFGPDGYLWFGLGDGSLGNDPQDKAQSLGSLRGKLLRIDPTPASGRAYTVPHDNPFLGAKAARPEIYAFGLRNPWRFSFDRATGDLWIGDVGQYIVEEVDFLPSAKPAGANFGWNRLEGSREFAGSPPPDAIPPIAEYNHDQGGCAVVGGYVYRGHAIEQLQGAYLYTDFCHGRILSLVEKKGRVVQEHDLGLRIQSPVSFGEDSSGELYVLSLVEGLLRIAPNGHLRAGDE
jgi:glucose/arabinose dehydrogenase